MKIILLQVGRTHADYVKLGIAEFEKRLMHYSNFENIYIEDIKNSGNQSAEMLKEKEGVLILKKIKDSDLVILLDETGKEFTSVKFAEQLQQWMNTGRNLIFIVGGAFGFSEAVYKRADSQLSLSRMTFTHQMIRLLFIEQLYRAFTILKGEKYHHS